MDTSKKYIEMCEKAEEIREVWKPHVGDFTADHQNFVVILESSDLYTKTGEKKDIKKLLIWWLPRQDQLQEMIVNWDIPAKLFVFGIPAVGYDENDPMQATPEGLYYLHSDFDSFEQLWLAFVMKEKYHKTWNGKDWVKEK